MINLKKFNPKNELKEFETETFTYNESGEFLLNEKDEKIWSYVVKNGQQETIVIFQMMDCYNEISVSYSSDSKSEEIRIKASKIAHEIRAKLNKMYKCEVILENPIIQNFEKYRSNIKKENGVSQKETFISLLLNKQNEKECRFEVYGLDGKILGEMLKENGTLLLKQEEGIYELILLMNEKSKDEFIQKAVDFGYNIEYIEPKAQDDHLIMQELFGSGLFQIDVKL